MFQNKIKKICKTDILLLQLQIMKGKQNQTCLSLFLGVSVPKNTRKSTLDRTFQDDTIFQTSPPHQPVVG